MKLFFKLFFQLLFIANVVSILVLGYFLIQVNFLVSPQEDPFSHVINLALSLKFLGFLGITNILVVLMYILVRKPQELYKELMVLWIIIFSVLYFFLGYYLFKDRFFSFFMQ